MRQGRGSQKRVVEFMNSADLSIADIQLNETVFSTDSLPKGMPAALRDEFLKDMAGRKLVEPRFFHKDTITAETVEFDESEESDGTRALFAFAGPWLDVIENERVLVVDELDTSLSLAGAPLGKATAPRGHQGAADLHDTRHHAAQPEATASRPGVVHGKRRQECDPLVPVV